MHVHRLPSDEFTTEWSQDCEPTCEIVTLLLGEVDNELDLARSLVTGFPLDPRVTYPSKDQPIWWNAIIDSTSCGIMRHSITSIRIFCFGYGKFESRNPELASEATRLLNLILSSVDAYYKMVESSCEVDLFLELD